MLPSIDLRIDNLIKALREVVLPALPENERLARDQAMLVIGHLGMIAAQWKDAARFEAGSLHTLCALGRDLLRIEDNLLPPERRAQLDAALREAGTVSVTDLPAVEAALLKLGQIVDNVISGDGSSAPMSPQLIAVVLDYGGRQAWRERVWFRGNNLDPDAKELPSITAMLSGAEASSQATSRPSRGSAVQL